MSSIKLTADSGGGTFELKAPASSSNTRSFTLPDVATGLGGITEFDQFYLSTASLTSEGDITSNLTRNNFLGSAVPLGTGMTVSSGIFTFPRTGKYLVTCQASFNIDGSDNVIVFTVATTDNFTSSKNVAIAMDANNGTGARTASSTSLFLLDVTDTSQVKVKFNVSSISGNSGIRGCSNPSADAMETNFCFIRLGDT